MGSFYLRVSPQASTGQRGLPLRCPANRVSSPSVSTVPSILRTARINVKKSFMRTIEVVQFAGPLMGMLNHQVNLLELGGQVMRHRPGDCRPIDGFPLDLMFRRCRSTIRRCVLGRCLLPGSQNRCILVASMSWGAFARILLLYPVREITPHMLLRQGIANVFLPHSARIGDAMRKKMRVGIKLVHRGP